MYPLNIAGVMENVMALYPSQSWDTSILPVLSSYGEPFMDVVCRDSCDGHDVGRVSILRSINFWKYLLRYLKYVCLIYAVTLKAKQVSILQDILDLLNWHLHCLILVQMLAFSLLDAIIAVDWQHRWLNYLNLKGYLKHMVEGLAHEDHMLQSMLDPSPEPLKVMLLLWTLNWNCFYVSVVRLCIYLHTWSVMSSFDQNDTKNYFAIGFVHLRI